MARKSKDANPGGDYDATNPAGGNGDGSLTGGLDGGITLDPASLGTGTGTIDGTEGTGKKSRKPRTPKASKQAPLDINTVKNSLIIAHMGLAMTFQAQELALTNEQADAYAIAAQDVLSHYDTGATAKTMAWVNLMAAMGGIYWTKFQQVANRKNAERAARVAAVNPNISRAQMGAV